MKKKLQGHKSETKIQQMSKRSDLIADKDDDVSDSRLRRRLDVLPDRQSPDLSQPGKRVG